MVATLAAKNGKAPNYVDVAVAGAGPAGLACALAIKASCPNVSVRVLERAKKMQPCGGNIGSFSPNIVAALNAIDPSVAEAYQSVRMFRPKLSTSNPDGSNKETRTIDAYNISWFDMQQALLSQLPDGILSLGSGVLEVSEDEDGVTVETAAGERVRCALLVGADGNHSVCRGHVQPGAAPEYVGACVWRFFMEADNPFAEVGEAWVLTGDGNLLNTTRSMRCGKAVTYCSGFASFPEEKLDTLNQRRYVQAAAEDGATHAAKIARFREAFAAFKPDLVDWIATHAHPEAVLEHPMYALNPRRPWHTRRVALVGDAAHMMPPNAGQGTPAAFEDAVQLGASLRRHGVSAAALDEYEAVRKQRVLPIWDFSTHQAVRWYRHHDPAHNPFSPATMQTPEGQRVFELIHAYDAPALAAA